MIPGIGVVTAHMILAEIGNIQRFKNAHKLARYIGIVPSFHQSDQMLCWGRITKQGNEYLRTAFVESAQTAIHLDPYLRYFYQKNKSKKSHNMAIVALAHKLVKSAFPLR